MTEGIIELNAENFETEVLKSDKPVLVDFWAEWCAPCRMLAPTISAIASDYDGRLRLPSSTSTTLVKSRRATRSVAFRPS